MVTRDTTVLYATSSPKDNHGKHHVCTTIRRLSRTSVQPARYAISVNFSDGNHLVVTPAMTFSKTVRSIQEMKLIRGEALLARVTFNSRGVPYVNQIDQTGIGGKLKNYIQAVYADLQNEESAGWVKDDELRHAQSVIDMLVSLYSPEIKQK